MTETPLADALHGMIHRPPSECRLCGLSVSGGSMGGANICPACDCGVFRNGERWTFRDLIRSGSAWFKERAQGMQP
jgi:hypothetical protein